MNCLWAVRLQGLFRLCIPKFQKPCDCRGSVSGIVIVRVAEYRITICKFLANDGAEKLLENWRREWTILYFCFDGHDVLPSVSNKLYNGGYERQYQQKVNEATQCVTTRDSHEPGKLKDHA
jgi:hypothetical protein